MGSGVGGGQRVGIKHGFIQPCSWDMFLGLPHILSKICYNPRITGAGLLLIQPTGNA